MKNQKRNNILLVLGSTVGLFLLNNILLGAIVPRLPGGSAIGITTMFVITWLSLKLKQFGVIPVVFLIYSLIGLPSHLAAGDTSYFFAIVLLVGSAIVFDILLNIKQYQLSGYVLAFPLLALMIKFSGQYLYFLDSGEWDFPNLQDLLFASLLGYTGIGIGYTIYQIQQTKTLKK